MLVQEQMKLVASRLAVLGLLVLIAERTPVLQEIKLPKSIVVLQNPIEHWDQFTDRVINPDTCGTDIPQVA